MFQLVGALKIVVPASDVACATEASSLPNQPHLAAPAEVTLVENLRAYSLAYSLACDLTCELSYSNHTVNNVTCALKYLGYCRQPTAA